MSTFFFGERVETTSDRRVGIASASVFHLQVELVNPAFPFTLENAGKLSFHVYTIVGQASIQILGPGCETLALPLFSHVNGYYPLTPLSLDFFACILRYLPYSLVWTWNMTKA